MSAAPEEVGGAEGGITEAMSELSLANGGQPEDQIAVVNSKFEVFKSEGNDMVKLEKFEDALVKYQEAWDVSQTVDEKAMILNNRGVVYEKMGNTTQAIEMFNEALSLKPAYAKVLIRRALVYRKLGEFEKAVSDITEAHAVAVKHEQMVTGLQDTTDGILVDFAEAEIAKVVQGRTFDFPKDYYVRAFFRGFYCDPISRIWKGFDPSPLDEFLAAHDGKGDAKSEIKGFLKALECLKLEKYSEIMQHCSEEIEAKGKFAAEALLLRGSLCFLSGLKEETMADFETVAEDENASVKIRSAAHVKAALCSNLWKSSEVAADHFAKAEALWSENADVFYHAAVVLVERAETIPALALLEKGIEVCSDPKQFPLLHAMALTIRFSYDACINQSDSAHVKLRELEKAGVFDIPECYELLAQTLFLVENGGDSMTTYFDKALEVSGNDKLFQIKKVMADHVIRNDLELSLKNLQKFTEDEDIASVAWYHVGELQFAMGKKEEGLAAVNKSVELCQSLYDIRVRVSAKVDLSYNILLAEKLMKWGVSIQTPEVEDKALE